VSREHPSPAPPSALAEAAAVVLEHCDRAAQGEETDAAVVAAVVGVERISGEVGTTEPSALRAAVTDALEGVGPAPVVRLVDQLVQAVATTLPLRPSGWRADASVINPDVGGHAVATDLASLRAAVRAARTSFDEVAYYRHRYGERGARFSVSDSSWIVHLTHADATVATRQVTWLADLLATRGMPTWLMERHLAAMTAELAAAGIDPGGLPAARHALAERRRAHVDDATLVRAEVALSEQVRHPPTSPLGHLVAAAAADVRSGAAVSTAPLLDWLCAPVRTDAADARAITRLAASLSSGTPLPDGSPRS
jgi:hypothetical protein